MDHTKLKISSAFLAFCYLHEYILTVGRRATVIAVLKVDVQSRRLQEKFVSNIQDFGRIKITNLSLRIF